MTALFSGKSRLGRVVWALVDQATFAIANFLLNIFLARLLVPQDYGVFALVFALYTFVFTLYGSLISEPMLVFGTSRYSDNFSGYIRTLFIMHWQLTLPLSLALFLIGGVSQFLGWHLVAQACLGLGIVIPTALLAVLVRRAAYPRNQQYLAGLAGVAYLSLVIGAIFLVNRLSTLTSTSAFFIMGVSGLLVGLAVLPSLTLSAKSLPSYTVWKQHWEYGSWSMPASLLSWLPWNFPLLVLPIWFGVEATATLRALLNVTSPVMNIVVLNNTLSLPIFTRARGTPRFKQLIWIFLGLILLITALNWLLVGVFHRPIVGWLYNGQYLSQSHLLWFLGVLPILDGAIVVFASALRALEKPRDIFRAYLLMTVVLLMLGFPSTKVLGILGTVILMFISFLIVMASLFRSLISAKALGNQP